MTTLPSGYRIELPEPVWTPTPSPEEQAKAALAKARLEHELTALNIHPLGPYAELTEWILANSVPGDDPHSYYMASEQALYQWIDNHWMRYSYPDQEWRPVCLTDRSERTIGRGYLITGCLFFLIGLMGEAANGAPGWLALFGIGIILMIISMLPKPARGPVLIGSLVAGVFVLHHVDKKTRQGRF